ncbi:MAG: hypothetical protein U9R34_08460 [Nanoarchaeota archaeon]|nr:hypothetical protein [Nanoarchaeota archaeon]
MSMAKQYLKDVIIKDSKGKEEVSILIEIGEYVRYHYINPNIYLKTNNVYER